MVRERVGDWRSAWRSALAGLAAGLLVIAVLQTGALDAPFFAAQDRLFPAPLPDPGITLVAIDQDSVNNLGYPLISNAYHARVINYLMSLNPRAILFDVSLHNLTANELEPPFADTNQPLIDALKAAQSKIVVVCTADELPHPNFEVGEAIGDRGFSDPDPGNAIRGVPVHTSSTCPENETKEPAYIQALRIAQGTEGPLVDFNGGVQLGPHRIPIENGQMLINFSRGGGPTCTYGQIFQGGCPQPSVITNHIVVVGAKVIDAGDVYSHNQYVPVQLVTSFEARTLRHIYWEARFDETAPLYMQVSRDGLVLHLSEHHRDCCPGSTVAPLQRAAGGD